MTFRNGLINFHSLFNGMSYFVQRLLIGWVVVILCLYAVQVKAQFVENPDQSAALASCTAAAAAYIAAELPGVYAPACAGPFPAPSPYSTPWESYTCKAQYNFTKLTCPSNYGTYHVWDPTAPACEDEPNAQITNYQTQTIPTPIQITSICQNSCVYAHVSTSSSCTYEDSNSSGSADDGDSYQCPTVMENTGESCSDGNQQNESPNPQYYDCTNVDCSSDPSPGGGTGESGDGGDAAGQDPPGGPSAGSGDGDPDTPSGPGTGSGDVDGDGTRDLDCNPQSNPDCGYTGSGSGSGNCDTQPSCSGDPVQCAILYQEWASMCYDPGNFTNPVNCQQALTCSGDVLKCEIIRQQRDQYCDLYVGDGSVDLDPTNNVDFDRDLKDEAETIDLPTAFDDSGLGAGSCPADYPIDTSLGTVTLSFATLCSLAPAIEIFILISALFSAAFIVIGSPGKGGSK